MSLLLVAVHVLKTMIFWFVWLIGWIVEIGLGLIMIEILIKMAEIPVDGTDIGYSWHFYMWYIIQLNSFSYNQYLNSVEFGKSFAKISLIIMFIGLGPQYRYKVSGSSRGHNFWRRSLFIKPPNPVHPSGGLSRIKYSVILGTISSSSFLRIMSSSVLLPKMRIISMF